MNLMDLFSGKMDSGFLNSLAGSVGAEPQKVAGLAHMGIPLLLQALQRNTETPGGARSLTSALEKHQDADLKDLGRFLGGVDKKDGAKILTHIFPGREGGEVKKKLADQTGLKTAQVTALLGVLAPMVLGFLGNQKKERRLDSGGVQNLLAGLVSSGGGGNLLGMAARMLDSNNDGNVMDDLGRMLGGFLGKK